MNDNMLQEIREALMARAQQFAKPPLKAVSDLDDNEPQAEIVDMAQSLEQLDRDSSLAEQERREQLAIDHAMAKLTSGQFGVCEDCSEDIPHKRLLALPEARLCANCQAVDERQASRMRVAGATR